MGGRGRGYRDYSDRGGGYRDYGYQQRDYNRDRPPTRYDMYCITVLAIGLNRVTSILLIESKTLIIVHMLHVIYFIVTCSLLFTTRFNRDEGYVPRGRGGRPRGDYGRDRDDYYDDYGKDILLALHVRET